MVEVREPLPQFLPRAFTWYKSCGRCETGDLYLDTTEGRTPKRAEIACYQCGYRLATDSSPGVKLLSRMHYELNSSKR